MTPNLQDLVGKSISHVWFGDYSSLYIELGFLSDGKQLKNGKAPNPNGEITIYVGFNWVMHADASVIGGSKSPQPQYKLLAEKLLHMSISNAELSVGSNNLKLEFAGNLALLTSDLTNSEPEWSVRFNKPDLGHLFIENGVLHVAKNS